MKQLLHPIFFFLLFYNNSLSQKQTKAPMHLEIFKDCDFNSGDYVLLGLRGENNHHSICDSIREFIIQDTVVLNSLKKSWQFNNPHKYFCDCDVPQYRLFLVKNKVVQFKLHIYVIGKTIETDQGVYAFDLNLLRKLYGKTSWVWNKYNRFNSLKQARSVLKDFKSRPSFIYATEDFTKNYERGFSIEFFFDKTEDQNYENNTALEARITELINEKFPEEKGNFKIKGYSYSLYSRGFNVQGMKSLYDKFQLNIDGHKFARQRWSFYSYAMESYWSKGDFDRPQQKEKIENKFKTIPVNMQWDAFSWVVLIVISLITIIKIWMNE